MDRVSDLGIKLKQARNANGFSTRHVAERLAKRIKISHATLANYEAGRSQPTMEVLAALAYLYQRPLNWFLSQSMTFSNIRYRNRKSRVRQTDLDQYEALAIKWLCAYRALEEFLQKPLKGDLCEFRFKDNESGRDAAKRLRRELGLRDEDRIPSVSELLERLGVRSIELPTTIALDGFAANVGDEYVVVLNSTVSSDRARLNGVHEAGHVLAGDCDSDDIDNNGSNEERAFEFASHLLLTPAMLREAFKERSMVRLVQFKERYGISVAAMIHRAENSRLLPKTVARRIWIEINKRGWRKNEPGNVSEDRAVRFERLLDAAILEGKLTIEQAAEIARVRTDELRRRHEWALGLVAWRTSPNAQGLDGETSRLKLVY